MPNQDSTAPAGRPTYDPGNSSMPRIRTMQVDEVSGYDPAEVLAAASAALEQAIDLNRPGMTSERCLTVSSIVAVVVKHPARSGWAVGRLQALAAEWRTS